MIGHPSLTIVKRARLPPLDGRQLHLVVEDEAGVRRAELAHLVLNRRDARLLHRGAEGVPHRDDHLAEGVFDDLLVGGAGDVRLEHVEPGEDRL